MARGRRGPLCGGPGIAGGWQRHRGGSRRCVFPMARAAGESLPEFAWAALQRAGVCLTHEGKTLEGDDANLQELRRRAAEFEHSRPTLYRMLGIA